MQLFHSPSLSHTHPFSLPLSPLSFPPSTLPSRAQCKIWLKPSGEQSFLYGNHVLKSGLGRITENTPQYQGLVMYSMNDLPLVRPQVQVKVSLIWTSKMPDTLAMMKFLLEIRHLVQAGHLFWLKSMVIWCTLLSFKLLDEEFHCFPEMRFSFPLSSGQWTICLVQRMVGVYFKFPGYHFDFSPVLHKV